MLEIGTKLPKVKHDGSSTKCKGVVAGYPEGEEQWHGHLVLFHKRFLVSGLTPLPGPFCQAFDARNALCPE
jgi:hypothetical protein